MDHYIAGDDERGRCRGILHVVKNGDTLYKIAKQYGVPLSRVMYANPYVDVYNLQIGDEICVPVVPRPPYSGNCPGCMCPPVSGNCPGMRPPMTGNCPGMRPPMTGNRPGMRPPISGNRPGMRPPMVGDRPGMRPSTTDERPEMMDDQSQVSSPIQDKQSENRSIESGGSSEIRSGDEMISSQPWGRMPDYSSMPQGQQGNSFPSVSIRRDEVPYSSMPNVMQDNIQNSVQDNIQDNIQDNMPDFNQGSMQDNMSENEFQSFQDPWASDSSREDEDHMGMPSEMQKDCDGSGCHPAHRQIGNRMPWHNTTNSERMMDEYLMGMPRMENQK